MGLCVFGGGSATIGGCTFKNNLSFGCQVEQAGSTVNAQECEFMSHLNSGAIMVSNGPNASFTHCVFSKNKNSHIEARDSSTVTVKGGEFTRTQCGVGVICSSSSSITLDGCLLHGERQSAVVSGEKGDITVNNCDIYNCKLSGIYLLPGSSGMISNCKIHKNGVSGIHAQTSTCTINDNEIYENKHYGIQITNSAAPSIGTNNFHDNVKEDINRA